eukprot:jgi/Botrbrau1/6431/Bobra.0034s0007.1
MRLTPRRGVRMCCCAFSTGAWLVGMAMHSHILYARSQEAFKPCIAQNLPVVYATERSATIEIFQSIDGVKRVCRLLSGRPNVSPAGAPLPRWHLCKVLLNLALAQCMSCNPIAGLENLRGPVAPSL